MLIQKTTETTPIQAEVVNTQSNSTTDAYSCNESNTLFNGKIKYDDLVSSTQAGGDVTTQLLHPYTDYDLLIVSWGAYYTQSVSGTIIIPTALLVANSSLTFEDEDWQSDTVKKTVIVDFPTTSSIRLQSTFQVTWSAGTTQLISVKGIKF